jgi:hypothetical protein
MGTPVGKFHGINVESDPNVPKGQIYFFNDNTIYRLDTRNRLQRISDSVKKCYTELMKKQYIFIGVLLVLVASVVVLSIYKYNGESKGITTQQAISQRNTALTDLKIQKALNDNDQQAITNLTADKTTLTTQKTTLCAQIKAAKLVQPLCQ